MKSIETEKSRTIVDDEKSRVISLNDISIGSN